jgi:predicted GNAT superfamily acetyltransferase
MRQAMQPFTIRDLTSYAEMQVVQQLQQEIWQFGEAGMGLYPPLLLSASKNGGVVLGAFDAAHAESMIAFLFSYIGREPDGFIKLYSQVMGVKQAWRHHGVGEALKRAQMERAKAMGLTLINWTFDPLEAPNARLNIGKLRAVSRTYWENVYGDTLGQLNAGLPTDRLLIEWWIQGERVNQAAQEAPRINEEIKVFTTHGAGIQRHITDIIIDSGLPVVALEIPAEFQSMKRADMTLALDWRMKTRDAFKALFDAGYAIMDFAAVPEEAGKESYYLLEKLTAERRTQIGIEK